MKKFSELKLGIRQKVLIIALMIMVSVTGYAVSKKIRPQAVTGPACKYFIAMDRDGTIYPNDLVLDLERIEKASNLPYDGIVFRIEPGTAPVTPDNMMSAGYVLDAATIDSELAPLRNMAYKPTKLKHNFVRVLIKPNDFYDTTQWDRIANNFKVLADGLDKLRDSGFGIDGIAFDNENYASCNIWNWAVGSACLTHATDDSTFRPYQDESRARGKQIMDKIIQQSTFKDLKMLTFLDSYFSCDNNNLHPYDNFWLGNELLGSFTLGMLEATVGTSAKVIDGGEYSYYVDNTSGHTFANRYNYAKNVMPTDPACSFMTRAKAGSSLYPNFALDNDRNGVVDWTQFLSVAHGLMKGQAAATFSNIQTNVKTALQTTDDYVWFYTERINSIDPLNLHPAESTAVWINSDGNDWNNQIWLGRQAVPNDPACGSATSSPTPSTSTPPSPSPSPSPSLSPTPTISPSTCVKPPAPTSFTASKNSANPTVSAVLTWSDASNTDHDGFWIWRSTTPGQFPDNPAITLPDPNLRTYTTSSLSPGTTYYFRIKSYKGTCLSDPVDSQMSTDPAAIKLNLTFSLQARSDASTTTYNLKIFPSGQGTPVYQNTALTASAGGIISINLPTSMTVGSSYDYYLKPKYWLADVRNGQVLTSPEMNIAFGVFKGGDLNDDNMINTLDFSVLSAHWMQNDPIADINKDSTVNTIDFAIMSANWMLGA